RKILAINTFVFGTGLILFSHAPWYALALVFATIGAFGMMSQVTISNTLIQTTVKEGMRGRVISFYAMAFFGMQPLGGLIIGYVSQKIDVQNTVMAQGIIALLIGCWHVYFLRKHNTKTPAVETKKIQPIETSVA
ncbi:MAG: MFS transporter, partial [Bacteroidetes bacterium]|nr:MFS transporter [Bacteroidota bacterium]